MRGVFVTGTDTGVGKSVVSAAICAALRDRGSRVAAFKPAVTGLAEPAGPWPPDHVLLAAAAATPSPAAVAPYRFPEAASPHYAAELAGTQLDRELLVSHALEAGRAADALVCEGVGGLLVPLTADYLVRDLAADLGLPIIVAARAGLGTINHTLLTVEAARSAGLEVAGVVMTPWPPDPSPLERSNRRTLERLAGAPVSVLPPTTPASLAAAGEALPLDDWFPESESRPCQKKPSLSATS